MGFLRNGAMMPALLPMVSWSPDAVVLLPYLGLLDRNHASGMPTVTYKPIATKKQPAKCTPLVVSLISSAYPMMLTMQSNTVGMPRRWK